MKNKSATIPIRPAATTATATIRGTSTRTSTRTNTRTSAGAIATSPLLWEKKLQAWSFPLLSRAFGRVITMQAIPENASQDRLSYITPMGYMSSSTCGYCRSNGNGQSQRVST
ncbi:hypothetical protein F5Y14DRAFT_299759 [Nemania sp. NC0429]|nr:hypothetical protein F5Y14DRAFT_299759 [Nemania sp. NC0429]